MLNLAMTPETWSPSTRFLSLAGSGHVGGSLRAPFDAREAAPQPQMSCHVFDPEASAVSSAERLSLRLRPVVRPIRQAHGPEALEGQAHHPEEDRGEGSPSTPLGTDKRGKLSPESFPRASNGGGGGSRTRVREQAHKGFYMLSLCFLSRQLTPPQAGSLTGQPFKSRPSPPGRRRKASSPNMTPSLTQ